MCIISNVCMCVCVRGYVCLGSFDESAGYVVVRHVRSFCITLPLLRLKKIPQLRLWFLRVSSLLPLSFLLAYPCSLPHRLSVPPLWLFLLLSRLPLAILQCLPLLWVLLWYLVFLLSPRQLLHSFLQL